MRRQVGRVLVAVTAVGALVSGCGAGPSQVGSAVIVGSTAVSLDEIQGRLDVALGKTDLIAQLAERGITVADIARDAVTGAIVHELLAEAAVDEGLTVAEPEIVAELDRSGGVEQVLQVSLYDVDTLREQVRDQLLAARLGERYVDRLSVTVDVTAAPSRAEAEQKARAIAAGGPGADAVFEMDAPNAERGVMFRAATDPQAAGTVLFGTPVGSTVVYQPSSDQSGWIVLQVTERLTDAPPTGDSAAPDIDRSGLEQIGLRLLQPRAEALGIRVNPRYGIWDPILLRVVQEGQDAGTILPAAAG